MQRLIRDLYASFNARDIEAVIAFMAEDVDWPNAWEGGRLRGREAVREYWTRQWAAIDPSVEPTGFESRPDGAIAVAVHQVVRSLDGEVMADGAVTHVYWFDGELVARMEVEEV